MLYSIRYLLETKMEEPKRPMGTGTFIKTRVIGLLGAILCATILVLLKRGSFPESGVLIASTVVTIVAIPATVAGIKLNRSLPSEKRTKLTGFTLLIIGVTQLLLLPLFILDSETFSARRSDSSGQFFLRLGDLKR